MHSDNYLFKSTNLFRARCHINDNIEIIDYSVIDVNIDKWLLGEMEFNICSNSTDNVTAARAYFKKQEYCKIAWCIENEIDIIWWYDSDHLFGDISDSDKLLYDLKWK